jgi:hypothetical protein
MTAPIDSGSPNAAQALLEKALSTLIELFG